MLGHADVRRWALLLCIAPALLALLPGLLPQAPDVPGYEVLFAVTWLLVGWPVAGVITLAGVAGRRATGRQGERAP
jgi:hypothetical protein